MSHEVKLGQQNDTEKRCPLCHTTDIHHFSRIRERDYVSCRTCRLMFVPAEQHISADEEKSRYDQHNNHPDDPDYRAFLSRIFVPMQQRLNPGSCGLDFGSGPGPTLSLMFEEAGHRMAIYDHFYAPTSSTLDQPYDFITATEVMEHLHRPGFELERLWSLLNPGGLLGVMTQLVPESTPFADWYYIKDPTHVCFFSSSTCEWLAEHWQAELAFPGKNVMLFQKRSAAHPV
jgi:Methyltransferase domain